MQNKRNAATFHHQGGNIERKKRGREEEEGECYVNSETNIRIWGLGRVEGEKWWSFYVDRHSAIFLENPRSENAVFYSRLLHV